MGISPYVVFRMFRDVVDAVPYAVIQNISIRQIPICQIVYERSFIHFYVIYNKKPTYDYNHRSV